MFGFNIVIYGFITDIFIIIEPVNVLNIVGGVMIHVMTMIIAFYKLCKTYRDNKKKKAEEKEKAVADAELENNKEEEKQEEHNITDPNNSVSPMANYM